MSHGYCVVSHDPHRYGLAVVFLVFLHQERKRDVKLWLKIRDLSLTPIKMAMLPSFFLDMDVSSTAGVSYKKGGERKEGRRGKEGEGGKEREEK